MPVIGDDQDCPIILPHHQPQGLIPSHRESLVFPWQCGPLLSMTPLMAFNRFRAMWSGGAEKPCDSVSSSSAGAEDQCALDSVLRHPQCFCACVQLDPGAPRPGGLRDRRGPPVVSKHPALAIQQDSQSAMFMTLGQMQRWCTRASGVKEVAREEYHYQYCND